MTGKENEVRLLEELGVKPDYVKLELNEEQTVVDQTASGELTAGAIEAAFERATDPISLNIPAQHQVKIRKSPLFTEYREEKITNGPIGRFMGVLVIVDEKLTRTDLPPTDNVAAYVLSSENHDRHVKIQLSP